MFHNEPKKTDGVGWDVMFAVLLQVTTHSPSSRRANMLPSKPGLGSWQLKETALLVSKRHRTSISDNYLEVLPVCLLFDT
jgi:hypothetical protein